MSEDSELVDVYKYCECGCGQKVTKRFKQGHNSRLENVRFAKGINSIRWKDGKHLTRLGYMLIRRPDHPFADSKGYVFEHRLVYEESHNCYLLPWVHIHHKDGNRLNNVWYNLQPLTGGQHLRLELTGKWKVDMSGRICFACGSDKTRIQKRNNSNRPNWCFHNGKPLCNKCYMKLWRGKLNN
jgi:hypothetical protein